MNDFPEENYDLSTLWLQLEAIALITNDPKDREMAERARQMYVLRQPLGRNKQNWQDDGQCGWAIR